MKSSALTLLVPPGGGRFDAVIFDMGGTLIEFENVPWDALYPSSVHSLHRWLGRHRKRVPDYDHLLERFIVLLERRRARIRAAMREYHITPLIRELAAGFGIHLRGKELSGAVNAYYAAIRRQLTVYPEAKPTLAALKGMGYTVALLSNTPFRVHDHRQELEQFGLWSHLDAALFTSTIAHRKPHPEPYRLIAKRLGVSLKRSLYIGDRQLEDVLGPQQVGMTACLIRRPGKKYEEGKTRSCEIWSLAELIPLLSPDGSIKSRTHNS